MLGIVATALGLRKFGDFRQSSQALILDALTVVLGGGGARLGRRATAFAIAALISIVPVLTVFVDKRPLGDRIALGLALVLWPVVLAWPGLEFRRHQHEVPPPAKVTMAIAMPIALIEIAVVGTLNVWNDLSQVIVRGVGYGIAFAAIADLAALVVTFILCIARGWPLYREELDPVAARSDVEAYLDEMDESDDWDTA
jgi:hypothetical protein